MKSKRIEIWVGLFILLGLILIGVLAIKLGDLTHNNKNYYDINVVFRNASGLLKGSEVRLGGAKIGSVSTMPQITSSGDAVKMTLQLEKTAHIQQGAIVQAATLNLLGDKYIEITPPPVPSTTFIQPGETIFGDSGDDLEKIKTNIATISQQTITLLKRVEFAMEDMQKATSGFAEMSRRINNNVLSEKNTENLSLLLANIKTTSEQLAKSSEAIPQTIENIKSTSENIHKTSVDAQEFMAKIDAQLDILAPSIKLVNPTMLSLKTLTSDAQKSMEALRKQQGLAGALLYDKNLKAYVEDFIRHLRAQGILRYKNPDAEQEILDLRDRAKMQGRRN